jgi:hypothetical protein
MKLHALSFLSVLFPFVFCLPQMSRILVVVDDLDFNEGNSHTLWPTQRPQSCSNIWIGAYTYPLPSRQAIVGYSVQYVAWYCKLQWCFTGFSSLGDPSSSDDGRELPPK